MARNVDYPFWPPLSRPANQIIDLQVRNIIADLQVNQIPRGSDAHIPVVQRTYPRQAAALGPSSTQDTVTGHTGTTLYDLFMAPYNQPQAGSQ